MLNIIQHPTTKNPTFAFTFYMLEFMQLGYDYGKKRSVEEAYEYIKSTKTYLLTANVEYFRAYCEKEVFDENPLQTSVDAMRVLHDLTIEMIQNKNRYQYLLEQTIEKANFMRILVKDSPAEYRPFLIVMAGSIVDFCKKELDECKKDKSKEQSDIQ